MRDYRRDRVPGGTFFFTVNRRDPRSDLLVTQIDILCDAVRRVRSRTPFLLVRAAAILSGARGF
jgi:putative transposase